MSVLVGAQTAIRDALRALPDFNGMPVISELDGDVVYDRDKALGSKHLAVIVGAAAFTPHYRDRVGRTIAGKAEIVVTVCEQPTRNRIGQPAGRLTLTAVAERIAVAVDRLGIAGASLGFSGIGPIVREDNAVSRDVHFEILLSLDGK